MSQKEKYINDSFFSCLFSLKNQISGGGGGGGCSLHVSSSIYRISHLQGTWCLNYLSADTQIPSSSRFYYFEFVWEKGNFSENPSLGRCPGLL